MIHETKWAGDATIDELLDSLPGDLRGWLLQNIKRRGAMGRCPIEGCELPHKNQFEHYEEWLQGLMTLHDNRFIPEIFSTRFLSCFYNHFQKCLEFMNMSVNFDYCGEIHKVGDSVSIDEGEVLVCENSEYFEMDLEYDIDDYQSDILLMSEAMNKLGKKFAHHILSEHFLEEIKHFAGQVTKVGLYAREPFGKIGFEFVYGIR